MTCYCMAPISLGAYVVVSQGAHLCAGTHAIDDPNFQLVVRPIEVGGAGLDRGRGLRGAGSADRRRRGPLGARAVAMKDLEPWAVYSGNPAARVRTRSFISREGWGQPIHLRRSDDLVSAGPPARPCSPGRSSVPRLEIEDRRCSAKRRSQPRRTSTSAPSTSILIKVGRFEMLQQVVEP